MSFGHEAVTAAVLHEQGGAFAIEQLSIERPRPDEILVQVVATGVCHTDAMFRAQGRGLSLPVVLGHEGAGIVLEVGDAVTKVVAGDHVVLTFATCGACRYCQSGHPSTCSTAKVLNFSGARLDGSHALHGAGIVHDRFFGQSSFATHAIATERNVVKVPKDVSLKHLGALGCGIQTGAGAVLNVLKVAPGSSIAVFGCGGVGSSALMAARVAGATTIIAVDLVASRRSLAMDIGATHAIDGGAGDIVEEIGKICPGGVDFAVDTTGRANVVTGAIRALAPHGTCGVIAAADETMNASINLREMYQTGKRIVGISEGDSVPDIFIPKLVELYRQGRFPIDRLYTFYPLSEINAAFADAESGVAVKPVLEMPV